MFDENQHGYEDEVLKTNQVENLGTLNIDHSTIEDLTYKENLTNLPPLKIDPKEGCTCKSTLLKQGFGT